MLGCEKRVLETRRIHLRLKTLRGTMGRGWNFSDTELKDFPSHLVCAPEHPSGPDPGCEHRDLPTCRPLSPAEETGPQITITELREHRREGNYTALLRPHPTLPQARSRLGQGPSWSRPVRTRHVCINMQVKGGGRTSGELPGFNRE